MAEKIIIASDSTSDLSPEQIAKYGVKILPLGVSMGGKTYTLDEAVYENGYYVIVGEPITALNFGKTYTIELYRGETLLQTMEYGIYSYVYSMQNKTGADGELTAMAKLARATYNYGAAARAYADAQ